jgi:hypothetical protein
VRPASVARNGEAIHFSNLRKYHFRFKGFPSIL